MDPRASNLAARTANIALPLESGIESAEPHLLTKKHKKTTTSSKSDAQTGAKVAKQAQQTPKGTSKSIRWRHIWCNFEDFFQTWAYHVSKLFFASNFKPKTTFQAPQNITFLWKWCRETCEIRWHKKNPIGPVFCDTLHRSRSWMQLCSGPLYLIRLGMVALLILIHFPV